MTTLDVLKPRQNLTWGTLSNHTVVFYASKLAAVAGMHPFVPREDIEGEYRMTVLGDSTSQWQSSSDRYEEVMSRLPKRARVEVETLISSTTQSNDDLLRHAEAVEGIGSDALEVVRETLYTEHGKRSEPEVRSSLSAAATTIECQRFQCKPWFSHCGLHIMVGGKHDGFDTENNRVVEIKTRQRRFMGVPLYELVQVHAYMLIFNTRNAILAESYQGVIREHTIAFDDAFWAQAETGVRKFLDEVILARS